MKTTTKTTEATEATNKTAILVRYNECDPMGIVHHAVYPVWFEIGRTELLRSQGGNYSALEKEGVYFVVADLQVSYKRPAKYDDKLLLVTSVASATPARVKHSYVLTNGDVTIATAITTIACVNSDGVVQRFPDSITN
jgi:acyl-CoA thioester hydrolase